METGDQKILISAEQRLGGWRRLRHQAGHQEGDPVAPEGQALLQVEGEVLHPDQGLLPLLQEGLLKALRDGRIPVQGELLKPGSELELETKIKRRFAKISQTRRRPLILPVEPERF